MQQLHFINQTIYLRAATNIKKVWKKHERIVFLVAKNTQLSKNYALIRKITLFNFLDNKNEITIRDISLGVNVITFTPSIKIVLSHIKAQAIII